MMYGFDLLKKKSNKTLSNCKLGCIFQTRFLQQILFSLTYEKLVISVNVCGWVPKFSRFAGRKSFQQSCSGNGLSLIPINHGGNLPHICQSRFLSQLLPPALEESRADGRVAAGITKMQGATALAGLFSPRTGWRCRQASHSAAFPAPTGVILQLASPSRWARSGPWVPGARWSWAAVWLSLGPESNSAVAICTSRVRPHPRRPFAYSPLLLPLCRAAQKFITQASLPPLLPLALSNIDVL